MVFITAGMGENRNRAAPVIAKLAGDGNADGRYCHFAAGERGKTALKQAMEAIAQLEQNVDALLVIDNDNVVGLMTIFRCMRLSAAPTMC